MKKEKLFFCLSALCFLLVFVSVVTLAVIKINLPYAYSAEIIRNSKKYNLDISFVRAVIRVESGYNECAKSVAGASGLMQIMPKTAEWIASQLGIENYNKNMLFEPEVNIEMGCYYLNYLYNKYEDDYRVLFAYNAGEGVLNEYYSVDQSLVLDSIEIKETKEYIKKVIKYKEGYEKLDHLISCTFLSFFYY